MHSDAIFEQTSLRVKKKAKQKKKISPSKRQQQPNLLARNPCTLSLETEKEFISQFSLLSLLSPSLFPQHMEHGVASEGEQQQSTSLASGHLNSLPSSDSRLHRFPDSFFIFFCLCLDHLFGCQTMDRHVINDPFNLEECLQLRERKENSLTRDGSVK